MATTATPTGGATAQTLSSWAGPYVTDVLGRANAIGNEAYQTYGGPRIGRLAYVSLVYNWVKD